MSYILDALRKADAQRERRSVPTLHANPLAGTAAPRAPTRQKMLTFQVKWVASLVVLVVLSVCGALLAWWLSPVSSSSDVPPAVEAVAVQAPLVAVPPARAPVVQRPMTASRWTTPASAAAPLKKPPIATPQSIRVLTFGELPAEIQRALPTLAVGGAMYSQNPASRMLIVNGQTFHEGQQLAPGLTLEQIRLKSAVLEYKGYRYSISY
jgi:general secretion pathway protein B